MTSIPICFLHLTLLRINRIWVVFWAQLSIRIVYVEGGTWGPAIAFYQTWELCMGLSYRIGAWTHKKSHFCFLQRGYLQPQHGTLRFKCGRYGLGQLGCRSFPDATCGFGAPKPKDRGRCLRPAQRRGALPRDRCVCCVPRQPTAEMPAARSAGSPGGSSESHGGRGNQAEAGRSVSELKVAMCFICFVLFCFVFNMRI